MRRVPEGTGVRWLLGAGLLTAAIGLTGCGNTRADSTPASVAGPARLEPVSGTDRDTVILTQEAASRLGIRTEPVRPAPPAANGAGAAARAQSVIPLAALLYDRNGATWTYTITQPLAYVRVVVTVVRVDGEQAVLESGPEVGTQVVTVGAAELLGAEYGVPGD
jgi:hypothetical protein